MRRIDPEEELNSDGEVRSQEDQIDGPRIAAWDEEPEGAKGKWEALFWGGVAVSIAAPIAAPILATPLVFLGFWVVLMYADLFDSLMVVWFGLMGLFASGVATESNLPTIRRFSPLVVILAATALLLLDGGALGYAVGTALGGGFFLGLGIAVAWWGYWRLTSWLGVEQHPEDRPSDMAWAVGIVFLVFVLAVVFGIALG